MLKPLSDLIKYMLASVLSLCMLILPAYAETATASADQDAIIAGKIVQTQQAQAQNQPASSTSQNAVAGQNSTASADSTNQSQSVTQLELPQLNQPIIDQANLLTAEQNTQLSQSIRTIHQSGKAQIGIVIVPSTGQEDIFDFAMRVAEKWQLGNAKNDNGLLMVVAVNDRRIQILTGYGLEGVIPDIVAHQIIQNQITPYFKNAQYAQGLQAGVNEIQRILDLDPEIAKQAADQLKQQQAEAHQQQQAVSSVIKYSMIILVIAVVASLVIGRKFASILAGGAGIAVGLLSGVGLITSLMIGIGMFLLIISSIAQLILQAFASGAGRGGGSGGGFGGGGGYSGGGGGFGGGGASGSW